MLNKWYLRWEKMWTKVGAVLVLSSTVFKRDRDTTVDGPPLHRVVLGSFSNAPIIPRFPSLFSLSLLLYGAHWQQLDNHLGTAFTVINTLLSNRSFMRRLSLHAVQLPSGPSPPQYPRQTFTITWFVLGIQWWEIMALLAMLRLGPT